MKRGASNESKAKGSKERSDPRSPAKVVESIGSLLKQMTGTLEDRQRIRHVLELFGLIIEKANSGEAAWASCVLHVGLEAARWLQVKTENNDPVILGLAKSVPAWPTLAFPHQKVVYAPAGLGLEHGLIDTRSLSRQRTLARDIGSRLLQVLYCTRTLAENRRYAENIHAALPDVIAFQDILGTQIASFISSCVENEAKKWDEDVQRSQNTLSQQLRELAHYLNVPNLRSDDALATYIATCIQSPLLSQEIEFCKWLILDLTNHKPAQNPVLSPLGAYRKDVYYRKQAKIQGKSIQQVKATAQAQDTIDSEIQYGILKRITDAMRKIGRRSPL